MQKKNVEKFRRCNARASCAGGREFESQRPAKPYTALQLVLHRFDIYAGSCVACIVAMMRRWAPQTRYTLRRNTANIIMKGFRLYYCALLAIKLILIRSIVEMLLASQIQLG